MKIMDENNECRLSVEEEPFFLKVGDWVEHIKDAGVKGVVLSIDQNLIPVFGVTTCEVKWDDCDEICINWTNKLQLINKVEASQND